MMQSNADNQGLLSMNAVHEHAHKTSIAYFTMEIALRPEVHTYSGGLGVLAGDTARSAADLELPVVFVSIVSKAGYIRQEIVDGRQVEHESPWDPSQWTVPVAAKVAVRLEDREVWIRPWLYRIEGVTGHATPVILLDTDLEENHPDDRRLTDALYGGDAAYRLKQEAILGIGGVRMLRALGFEIDHFHMNEGHAALLTLELMRWYHDFGGSEEFVDLGRIRSACIFTTHTPVEAGHDKFPYDLVLRVLNGYVDPAVLRRYAGEQNLNMTQLALSFSGYINGVAKRHAETSRKMFPGYRVHSVTNGVHSATWTWPSFSRLYNEHFPDWRHDPEVLLRAVEIPDAAIRAAHREAKEALAKKVAELTGVTLDPSVATIGFARRMTSYKRANLIFQDIARLKAIARERPFQLVMAGKAHPRDTEGKRLIELIHREARELSDTIPVVFLPSYDMDLARYIVSGVDVWLNTPLPPLEASGTSGMKAAMNGVLNLSVLDGWWVEGCIEGHTGWAIGDGNGDGDHSRDAALLYDKLQNTVLPLYYDQSDRWTWMMKEAISRIGSYFNTHRMMRRYAAEAYLR